MKAIETRYKQCRFRSRVEARWAVFFDALRLRWEYEPEGFELGDGTRYLPDFWLPDLVTSIVGDGQRYTGCWFEVKGEPPTDKERRKALRLAIESRYPVFIFGDSVPRPLQYEQWMEGDYKEVRISGYGWFHLPDGRFEDGMAWGKCATCGQIEIAWWAMPTACGHETTRPGHDHPDILAAFAAARGARFEFGERGEVR